MQIPTSTAAAFTARRAPFPASCWLLTLLFLAACSAPNQQARPVLFNRADVRFSQVNGLVCHAGKPFTGRVFTLFPATSDTSELGGYQQGREDGLWQQYYPGGALRQQRSYANGQKTGDYVAWWPNRQQQLHYRFSEDEYEGTCREWNEKGVLLQEMNYHKGHEEGRQRLFYNDGKVRANYTIIDGRRYGLLGTKNCVNVSDSVFRQ